MLEQLAQLAVPRWRPLCCAATGEAPVRLLALALMAEPSERREIPDDPERLRALTVSRGAVEARRTSFPSGCKRLGCTFIFREPLHPLDPDNALPLLNSSSQTRTVMYPLSSGLWLSISALL